LGFGFEVMKRFFEWWYIYIYYNGIKPYWQKTIIYCTCIYMVLYIYIYTYMYIHIYSVTKPRKYM
jgi:hypothetical protein